MMTSIMPRAAADAPSVRRRGFALRWKRLVDVVVAFVLILTVACFIFLAVGPRFLGYQTSTMLTGSMSPGINPGDVVVSVPIRLDDLHVGDVITYSIPVEDHRVETHRVISIDRGQGGATTVQTKGDANPVADPWSAVLEGDHVYRQVATIPYLGNLIRLLREPVLRNVLIYGAAGVLTVGILVSIWGRKPEEDKAMSL